MAKNISFTIKYWKQNGPKDAGHFDTREMHDIPDDTSFLEMLDILNLKCDPVLIASLRGAPGLLPAYHMNKENWITAALDGSAPEDKLRLVLDMSYTATAPKLRKKKA